MSKCSVCNIDYLDVIMLDYQCTLDDVVKCQQEAFNKILNEDNVVHLAVLNFNLEQLDTCADVDPAPEVNQLPFSMVNHAKLRIVRNINLMCMCNHGHH